MKIAMIGAGMVGGTLGKRFADVGHEVMYGVRSLDDEKAKALVGPRSAIGAIHEACAWADVVLLAVPYDAVQDALAAAGDLKGKILVDTTNPLKKDYSGLTFGFETSAAEQIAELALGASVVKAFNTVGFNVMADTSFESGKPAMFYCGDDADAKQTVHLLCAEIGFDPVDAGPLSQARNLEPMAMLWISMAMRFGHGRDIAFSLLKR